jgi:hypothetical protein
MPACTAQPDTCAQLNWVQHRVSIIPASLAVPHLESFTVLKVSMVLSGLGSGVARRTRWEVHTRRQVPGELALAITCPASRSTSDTYWVTMGSPITDATRVPLQ